MCAHLNSLACCSNCINLLSMHVGPNVYDRSMKRERESLAGALLLRHDNRTLNFVRKVLLTSKLDHISRADEKQQNSLASNRLHRHE